MMKSALVASDFQWIIPEIVLVVVGLAVLLVSAGRRGKGSSTACGVLTLAGGIAAFCFAIRLWGAKADLFNALYVVDDFGTFLKYIFLAILLLVSLISLAYTRREEIVSGEYYSLLLFAVFGMMVMVSSNSFVTIFIGLEVMSLSIYILCGLLQGEPEGNRIVAQVLSPGLFRNGLLPLRHSIDLRVGRNDRYPGRAGGRNR